MLVYTNVSLPFPGRFLQPLLADVGTWASSQEISFGFFPPRFAARPVPWGGFLCNAGWSPQHSLRTLPGWPGRVGETKDLIGSVVRVRAGLFRCAGSRKDLRCSRTDCY